MDAKNLVAFLKKRPVACASVGLSVVLAVFGYFRHSSMGDLEGELERVASQSERMKANITNATSLQENYDEIAQANVVVNERLVKKDNLAINLQYFYKIESEVGVKLQDIRQLSVSNASAKNVVGVFATVPYNVVAEGGYRELLLFIKKLESGARYCYIANATMNEMPSAVKEANGKLSLVLSIELLGEL